MPENINIGSNLQRTFGRDEPELAAVAIILYCRQTGPEGWKPFTFADINNFMIELKKGNLIAINAWQLNLMSGLPLLVAEGWITERASRFYVADAFLERCYQMYPATKKKGE